MAETQSSTLKLTGQGVSVCTNGTNLYLKFYPDIRLTGTPTPIKIGPCISVVLQGEPPRTGENAKTYLLEKLEKAHGSTRLTPDMEVRSFLHEGDLYLSKNPDGTVDMKINNVRLEFLS